MSNVGLLAAAPVKWLLDNEPEVKEAVRRFIIGQSNRDYVDVALPPDWLELLRFRAGKQDIRLPLIRLHLKIVNDHLSGVPHVLVTCSDAEMQDIVDMARALREKKNETLVTAEIMAARGV